MSPHTEVGLCRAEAELLGGKQPGTVCVRVRVRVCVCVRARMSAEVA